MTYRYLPDVSLADVAFEARAPTLEGLLAECAKATTNAMVKDLKAIEPAHGKRVRVEAADAGELVRRFLEELLFWKDAQQLVFSQYDLAVKTNENLVLTGTLRGEPLHPKRHEQLVDVKAVTLHLFEVKQTPRGWLARVVLDV